ncbi:uncharacterized protein LOC101862893 [Aplysia californica]|uniref:Uncharacterized protein LOC101862893 n=1 Tax=Aplysia californica TaxID=6500 RepID=A0ABM1A8K5_APLCA|nr:uncharacterized protein LOC101862893 [Aplysia californica]
MAPQIMSAVLLSLMAVSTHGFSTGAQNNNTNPMSAFSSSCASGNFRPNHKPFMPQVTYPNYTITVSSPSGKIYRPGQIVTVTIESVNGAKPFKGFFLHGDSTEASFAGELSCDKGRSTRLCTITGVTHVDPTPKPKVVCKWTPPDFDIGVVQFSGYNNFVSAMTYEQKAIQMREQMMRQFQSGQAADVLRGFGKSRIFGGQQNSMGAGRGGAAQGQANPFAQLFSGGRQSIGQGDKNVWSAFRGVLGVIRGDNAGGSNSEKPAALDTGRITYLSILRYG